MVYIITDIVIVVIYSVMANMIIALISILNIGGDGCDVGFCQFIYFICFSVLFSVINVYRKARILRDYSIFNIDVKWVGFVVVVPVVYLSFLLELTVFQELKLAVPCSSISIDYFSMPKNIFLIVITNYIGYMTSLSFSSIISRDK